MPGWIPHSVFYQIFPDRFYRVEDFQTKDLKFKNWNSIPSHHSFHGGNLWGITDKLDYLKDLGISAIYLNPIFQSASNHRYHTYDFYQVDPMLGGNKAFYYLMTQAHKRNIKIILDGVFNHVGRGFWPFHHLMECEEESPYKDWFHIKKFPLNAYSNEPNYECWWNLSALPKLNYGHAEVREHILGVARYWIQAGIDGWRLDVPNEVQNDFWPEFCYVVRQANPDAYILGEIWADEVHNTSLQWVQPGLFDGVMNYGLMKACTRFFAGEDASDKPMHDFLKQNYGAWNRHSFQSYVEELHRKFSFEQLHNQFNLLESHDTTRFLWLIKQNRKLLRLAYTFILSYPGAPSMYYGSEWGVDGGADPDSRRTIPWGTNEMDFSLKYDLQKIIHFRHQNEEWRIGSFHFLPHHGHDHLLIYERRLEEKRTVFILNNSPNATLAKFPVEGEPSKWKNILTSQIVDSHENEVHLDRVEPYESVILQYVK